MSRHQPGVLSRKVMLAGIHRLGRLITLGLVGLLLGGISSSAQNALEPYVEIELERLETTYALLDAYAEEIWPGWRNYRDVEFLVQFPNFIYLLVNPRNEAPPGYQRLPGRELGGRSVFINREGQLPLTLKPPLLGAGGPVGGRIHIRLEQRKNSTNAKRSYVSSESQILMYVHELFHCFQEGVWEGRRDAFGDRYFPPNPAVAAYSEIEGEALLRALRAEKRTEAEAFLRDYLAARERKQKYMDPLAAKYEQYKQVAEGTAQYAQIKAALIVREKGFNGSAKHRKDPYFFGFGRLDEYLDEEMVGRMNSIKGETSDTIIRCYLYGLYQCLILDRLSPGWKKGFLESGRSLDEALKSTISSGSLEGEAFNERFRNIYRFDDLYVKHRSAIRDIERAVGRVEKRKGKKYIIDLERTRDFFDLKPRGQYIRQGGVEIFLNGFEDLTLGGIELSTADTPLVRPWTWSIEWVDTETRDGEKGFELDWSEKQGDVYKGLVFKTAGFTLSVPEAKILEGPNTIRIIILKKA